MDATLINALQAKFGTSDFSRFQIIRSPWYDTVRYNGAGQTSLTFFTVPLGGTDPVSGLAKTTEQTNVVKQGSFGQTYFLATQIRTQVRLLPKNRQAQGAVSGDANAVTHGLSHQATNYFTQLAKLLTRGVLTIAFAQKEYFTNGQPLLNLPPGFGIEISVLPEKAIAGDAILGGTWLTQSTRAQDVWQTSPAQLIEPEIAIAAAINFPSGTSPAFTNTFLTTAAAQSTPSLEIMLAFDGYQIRPQQ